MMKAQTALYAGFILSIVLHALLLPSPFGEPPVKSGTVMIEIEGLPNFDRPLPRAAKEKRARVAPKSKELREAAPDLAAEMDSESTNGEANESQSPRQYSVYGTALGIHPIYPKISRTLGEEGRVTIEIPPRTAAALEPKVVSSSGFTRLDGAALGAVAEALRAETITTADESFRVTFVFRLKDGN